MESCIYTENFGQSRVWVFRYCFLWRCSSLRGKGTQGQSENHQVYEGDKWCYNRYPLIYEVRRGTWWPKYIMCIERTLRRQERTSPDFNLPKNQWKKLESQLMSRVGIPMLSERKACLHIKYGGNLICIQVQLKCKVHSESSHHCSEVQVKIKSKYHI